MSIAANAISESPLAADASTTRSASKAPAKRTAVAVADAVERPDAR